jgi:hypothetical protein
LASQGPERGEKTRGGKRATDNKAYHRAKLLRRSVDDGRRQSGGSRAAQARRRRRYNLGFAGHDGDSCGRWEVKGTGGAICCAAEGPRRVGVGVWGGVPQPDSGSSLARGGGRARRAGPAWQREWEGREGAGLARTRGARPENGPSKRERGKERVSWVGPRGEREREKREGKERKI